MSINSPIALTLRHLQQLQTKKNGKKMQFSSLWMAGDWVKWMQPMQSGMLKHHL